MHSFRHTNETATDSLGFPEGIRRQRIGNSAKSVTDRYTHTFTEDERAAPEKLGDFFGIGWPEIETGKLISFSNLSQEKERLEAVGSAGLC